MAEKYSWVVIPQDASTLDECEIFATKPNLTEMQEGVGGGRIENLPKSYWKMKGIKTIYVNDEGLFNPQFKSNFIVNQMLAGDEYIVMTPYGVLNRGTIFTMHMTVVKKSFEGIYMDAKGRPMRIIGPCVAQVKLSTLERAIKALKITSDFVQRKYQYAKL
jgi:hypothetical protein